jgi:aconitate hydratase
VPPHRWYLSDIWPTEAEISEVVDQYVQAEMFTNSYADVFTGDDQWRALPVPDSQTFLWDPESTYVRKPPYFDGMGREAQPLADIRGARVLAKLGDSVTTDHISPAGSISPDTPAGKYLTEQGIEREDFSSYGSRRGNHEVMIRGTFANIRLRNQLATDTEGGWTRDFTQPDGPVTTIYEASMHYSHAGTPLVVLAGEEYGSGSSRDWAAKGSKLLGIRAVLVESFERIHRSNLVGMGVLPLEFLDGGSVTSLGLTGFEQYRVVGLEALSEPGPLPREVVVSADDKRFSMRARIDTPFELAVFLEGGILPYTLRRLVRSSGS